MAVYECETCGCIEHHATQPKSCGLCGNRVTLIADEGFPAGVWPTVPANDVDQAFYRELTVGPRHIVKAAALSVLVALAILFIFSDTGMAECQAVASHDTCAYALLR